jgi:toxin FitB
MVLLDTNILIYLAQGKVSYSQITGKEIAISSVTYIEALGYDKLLVKEQLLIEKLLEQFEHLTISSHVIERAIILKQQKRMTLGDSIIAATAIENNCELWTANTDDFKHIDDIKITNPLK